MLKREAEPVRHAFHDVIVARDASEKLKQALPWAVSVCHPLAA
jgi:hypothetical protein